MHIIGFLMRTWTTVGCKHLVCLSSNTIMYHPLQDYFIAPEAPKPGDMITPVKITPKAAHNWTTGSGKKSQSESGWWWTPLHRMLKKIAQISPVRSAASMPRWRSPLKTKLTWCWRDALRRRRRFLQEWRQKFRDKTLQGMGQPLIMLELKRYVALSLDPC